MSSERVAPAARPYDVVLFGATGFTGGLTAAYLAGRLDHERFTLAFAGRDRAKLEALRARIAAQSHAGAHVALIEAHADDPASLARMAASARVVATTVGPYATHGEPVVAAAVEAGADYVDLTGEPAFVDRLLARYDAPARAAGARVVPSCGYDSVPFDLGTQLVVSGLPAKRAGPIAVEAIVAANGSFSGGTWASALGILATRGGRRAQRARAAAIERTKTPDGRIVRLPLARAAYRRPLRCWLAPMGTIDPQVVARSACALAEYGTDFSYAQYARCDSFAALAHRSLLLGAVGLGARFARVRRMLARVRPPGTGPSVEQRARSRFAVDLTARAGDAFVAARVRGGDPGYGETSKMLGEAALCLALDRALLPAGRAGVLTPAVAMGEVLRARLVAAGLVFELLDARDRPATG